MDDPGFSCGEADIGIAIVEEVAVAEPASCETEEIEAEVARAEQATTISPDVEKIMMQVWKDRNGQFHWPVEEIYTVFRDQIYRYIRHLIGNHESAEDLTQDTFLKVMQALPKMSQELRLSSWIYKIATNTVYDAQRHINLKRILSIEAMDARHRF